MLAGAIRDWAGTLEDAVVAVTALRLRVPVWTLNVRDLGARPELRFWNPS
jgi:predicted nucleic acid-binding protein